MKIFSIQVNMWITFNEPYTISNIGYEKGLYMPDENEAGVTNYIAAHNLLKAHAKTYKLYHDEYSKKTKDTGNIYIYVYYKEIVNLTPFKLTKHVLNI